MIGILLIEFADPYPIPLFVTTATSTEPSTAESLTKLTSVLVDQCVGTGMYSVESNLITSFGLIL